MKRAKQFVPKTGMRQFLQTVVLCCIALGITTIPVEMLAKPAPSKKKSPQSVRQQKSSLARLKKSIEYTRSKLRKENRREMSALKKLNLYRQQSDELNSYLYLLQDEITIIQDSVVDTEQSLLVLGEQLVALQEEYADLCRTLYKVGRTSDAELLVTKKSYDHDLRNSRYMQKITALANFKADEIVRLRDSISRRKLALVTLLDTRNSMMDEKVREQDALAGAIVEKESALKAIRTNKRSLAKQLKEKMSSAKKVERIIAVLIEKERKRKAEEEARRQRQSRGSDVTGKRIPKPSGAVGSQFKPRSLPWPVKSRKILHKFGEHRNPITKTVTDNLGIGIKTAKGTSVAAVHGGTVSLVHWLPGYGSLVIIDHGNSFRTVYANLAAVMVKEGQKVSSGTALGKSGKSVDGEYVHFEIWRNKEKLNPTRWLN